MDLKYLLQWSPRQTPLQEQVRQILAAAVVALDIVGKLEEDRPGDRHRNIVVGADIDNRLVVVVLVVVVSLHRYTEDCSKGLGPGVGKVLLFQDRLVTVIERGLQEAQTNKFPSLL